MACFSSTLPTATSSPTPHHAPRGRLTEYRTLDRKAEASKKLWRVPVCLSYRLAGAKLARQCALVETHEARVELDAAAGCPAFVYANAGEDGYYRVGLGPEQLAPLARAFGRLPERERFGVVSNAAAAVRSGDLPGPDLLALMSRLPKEASRLVWTEVIEALWTIDRALVTDDARPAFVRFVRELGAPTAHRLGWRNTQNESDDDHFLRENVLRVLGDLGEDGAVLAEADRLARKWLSAPHAAGGVGSNIARIALPLAAKHGDAALWQQLAGVLRNPATPEIRILALSGLTAFDDRALTERTLALVLDGTIKPQDIRYVLPELATHRASREVAITWIEVHFDELVPKLPPAAAGRILRAGAALCDGSRVLRFESTMRRSAAKIDGADRDLRNAVEEALRCAALSDAQRSLTSAWLTRAR